MPENRVPNNRKSRKQEKVKGSKTKHKMSKRKQEDDNAEDKNQEEVITCKSLSEAESKILELLNQGKAYNELLKIQFKIGDRIKRFNPRQISTINKAANTAQESNKADTIPINDNKVQTIFKLLKKGKSLTDIVIKTGIESEVVRGAFEQYIRFENYVLCPKEIYKKMHSLVLADYRKYEDANYASSQIGFEEIWADLSDLHIEYENLAKKPKLIFKCSNCGNWTDPDKEDMIEAAVHLSEHNVCHNCA